MRVLDTLRAYESDRREIWSARGARANQANHPSRKRTLAARAGRGRGGRGGGVGTYQLRDVIVSRGGERLRDLRGEGRGAGWVSEPPGLAGKNEVDGRFVHAEATWKRSSDTHRHVVPAERLVALLGAFPAPLAVAPLRRSATPRLARVHRTTPLALRREEKRAVPSFDDKHARTHDRNTEALENSKCVFKKDYLVTKKKIIIFPEKFKLPVETACVAPSEGAP